MKFNWPFSRAGTAIAGLCAFVLMLFLVLPGLMPAQTSKAASVYFSQIVPGNSGTLPVATFQPVAYNRGGQLVGVVGPGRYASAWPSGDWETELVVKSTNASDTAIVRIKARPLRTTAFSINYLDTLVSGQTMEIPRLGEQVTGFDYGLILVQAGDLSGVSAADTTSLYVREYASYSASKDKRRMWFHASMTSTVPDTSAAVGWAGRNGLSLALMPGTDSCTVDIRAQVFASGSWQPTTLLINDSTGLSASAWTTFTPPTVLTGDSLKIIITPEAPFKAGYVPLRGALTAL